MFFPDPLTGKPLDGEELVQAKFQYMSQLMTDYIKARNALNNEMYYNGEKIFGPSDADKIKIQTLVIDDLAAKLLDFATNELLTMDNNPPGGGK